MPWLCYSSVTTLEAKINFEHQQAQLIPKYTAWGIDLVHTQVLGPFWPSFYMTILFWDIDYEHKIYKSTSIPVQRLVRPLGLIPYLGKADFRERIKADFREWSRRPPGDWCPLHIFWPLLALPDRCVHKSTICSDPKGSVCIQIEVIYVCHIHIYSHKAAPPYQAKYIQEDSRTIMGPLLRTMSAAVSPEQRPSFEFCKKMAPPMLCSRLVVQDCSPSQATQYQHKTFLSLWSWMGLQIPRHTVTPSFELLKYWTCHDFQSTI